MLQKENRLKRSAEFDQVYKKGQFFGTKMFTFRFLENSLPDSRIGFVVGTKVHKKSTKRNLLKRRMREVIRLNLDKIKQGLDIVIVAKLGSVEMEFAEIERDIIFALKKTGILK